MFSITILSLIGVILITVVFLFGIFKRKLAGSVTIEHPSNNTDAVVHSKVHVQPHPTHDPKRSELSTKKSEPVLQNNRPGFVDEKRFPRPATPIQSNHYRSVTAVVHRPTPTVPNAEKNAAAKADRPQDVVSEDSSRDFKKYQDLTAAEKDGIVNLNQCTIHVGRSVLDPILALIGGGNNEPVVEYLIAYFDKRNDKYLSPSEKFVRKSFKIKTQQSNMCRFARLKIVASDANYHRLTFYDYTPYVDEHSPKFDVSKQLVGPERSHWESIDVSLHHNTQAINAKVMRVLVPGKKGD